MQEEKSIELKENKNLGFTSAINIATAATTTTATTTATTTTGPSAWLTAMCRSLPEAALHIVGQEGPQILSPTCCRHRRALHGPPWPSLSRHGGAMWCCGAQPLPAFRLFWKHNIGGLRCTRWVVINCYQQFWHASSCFTSRAEQV